MTNYLNHIVANPDKYDVTQNTDGTWTIRPSYLARPSEIIQQGTLIDAALMNGITSQLADKATKGQIVSADLKIAADADRLKLVNMSDEVLQAMAGNTPVNATPTVNSVTREKVANKAITADKTTFVTTGKNLFDLSRATSGMRVNKDTGAIIAEIPVYPVTVSDYILIESNTQYALRYGGEAAFYDQSYVYISGVARSTSFTTPANAVYVRHNTDSGNVAGQQLEKGRAFTTYEPYNLYAETLKLKKENFTTASIARDHLDFKVPELIQNKNLFNYKTAIDGKYVDATSGNLANEIVPFYYWASDYIPVTAGQTYSIPSNQQLAWYNSSKQYISGSSNLKTVTAPAGSAFLRVSVPETQLKTWQVEQGATSTNFVPFGYTINDLSVVDPLKNDTYLNHKTPLHVTTSGAYQINWKRLLKNYNPSTMRLSVTSAPAGSKLKTDVLELNNVAAGQTQVTAKLEYMSGEEIATQNIVVHSSNKATKTAQQYLLMIGDSLTRELGFTGAITSELTNVTAVGTRSLNDDGIEVNEGRGGWKLDRYAAEMAPANTVENPFIFPNGVAGNLYFGNTDSWKKICHTDPNNYEYKGFQLIAKDWNTSGSYQYDTNGYRLNPPNGAVMFDPTKPNGQKYQQYNGTAWVAMTTQPTGASFDFAKYLERFKVAFGNGTKNPTVISIMLGTNDLQNIRRANGVTMATMRGHLTTMLNSIKAWNPNVKVILCVPPLSSTQDRWGDARGIDMTKWEFDANIHLLADELTTNSAFYPMAYTIQNFIGVLTDEVTDYNDWLHPSTNGKAKLGKHLAATVQFVR